MMTSTYNDNNPAKRPVTGAFAQPSIAETPARAIPGPVGGSFSPVASCADVEAWARANFPVAPDKIKQLYLSWESLPWTEAGGFKLSFPSYLATLGDIAGYHTALEQVAISDPTVTAVRESIMQWANLSAPGGASNKFNSIHGNVEVTYFEYHALVAALSLDQPTINLLLENEVFGVSHARLNELTLGLQLQRQLVDSWSNSDLAPWDMANAIEWFDTAYGIHLDSTLYPSFAGALATRPALADRFLLLFNWFDRPALKSGSARPAEVACGLHHTLCAFARAELPAPIQHCAFATALASPACTATWIRRAFSRCHSVKYIEGIALFFNLWVDFLHTRFSPSRLQHYGHHPFTAPVIDLLYKVWAPLRECDMRFTFPIYFLVNGDRTTFENGLEALVKHDSIAIACSEPVSIWSGLVYLGDNMEHYKLAKAGLDVTFFEFLALVAACSLDRTTLNTLLDDDRFGVTPARMYEISMDVQAQGRLAEAWRDSDAAPWDLVDTLEWFEAEYYVALDRERFPTLAGALAPKHNQAARFFMLLEHFDVPAMDKSRKEAMAKSVTQALCNYARENQLAPIEACSKLGLIHKSSWPAILDAASPKACQALEMMRECSSVPCASGPTKTSTGTKGKLAL
ncbi:hypothetical protein H9P43_004948 [Blastocladiella emersonii ATCC 22665]|nr:hypothetical protein H9P43_004948 [Blastocladiella emersonii ATCC 22665]